MRFSFPSVPIIYYFTPPSVLFLLHLFTFTPLWLGATPNISMPLSDPPLPLHVSRYPTSVWGTGVDRELASCQANYATLCVCPALRRTREANASPLHHPYHHWLDPGLGLKCAREWMAWPGPYAFNAGADVKRRPWALTPLILSLCPSSRPYYRSSCSQIAGWTSLMEGNWHAQMAHGWVLL